jgi:DNA-binding NtrC family response regulator
MHPSAEVLLVDDDNAVVAVVTRILKKSGFRVTTANSLPKARSILSQRNFTVLIYDLSVGAGRRLGEVIDELRAAQPKLPVLLITGYAGPDTESEVERLRIELLEKPFEADELVARLTELIKRSKHSAA